MMQSRQQGAVLVVSLVMLVVLTLFVLSSTRMATGNLRIVGNFQAKQDATAQAQSVIEQVLSSIAPFYSPTAAVTIATPPSGMTASVGARTCVMATTAQGYSAVSGVSPQDTYWNVPVTISDNVTNSTVAVTQGVRIRLPAGNC